jgi:hypothetical protein
MKNNMISLEIPDPFEVFVKHKYANFRGMRYDFFAREWTGQCLACGEELYSPSKKEYTKNRLYHSRNICTGGW